VADPAAADPGAQDRRADRPGADDPGRGRRLGVDVGTVRIGVAASDPDGILATPLETVRRERTGRHLRRLTKLVEEHGAVEVIVGLPRTLAEPVRSLGAGRHGAGRPAGRPDRTGSGATGPTND
jgi:hypothetical protein